MGRMGTEDIPETLALIGEPAIAPPSPNWLNVPGYEQHPTDSGIIRQQRNSIARTVVDILLNTQKLNPMTRH
jgi:hypothetical protein